MHQRLDDRHGWDETVAYGDGTRYEEVFRTVKDVLGHRSVETTKSVYLPRVQRLRFDRLFGDPNPHSASTSELDALAKDLVEVRDLTDSACDEEGASRRSRGSCRLAPQAPIPLQSSTYATGHVTSV